MDDRHDQAVLLNVLAGIGLGALVGAAVALLFAPKPGAELREDVGTTLDDLKVKAEKVAGDLVSKAEELVAKGRETLESTQSRIKEAVSAGRDAISQAQAETEEALEDNA